MHVIKNAADEYWTGDRFSPHQRCARRYDHDAWSRLAAADDAVPTIITTVFGTGARLVYLRPHDSHTTV